MAPRVATLILALALLCCHSKAQQIGGDTSLKNLVESLISGSGLGLPSYYAPVGSSAGISGLISGKYVICGSQSPLTTAQYSQAKAAGITVCTFPLALTTYSIVNNKGGFSLKACDLAKIYLGNITSWFQVPGAPLSGTIIPLLRNSGSRTTEIFTTYLKKACPGSWPNSLVGPGPFNTGNPNLKLVSGSDGMGAAVAADDNAIGYIQTSFGDVKYKNVEVAIENKAGKYVTVTSSVPYQSIPQTLPDCCKSWSGVDLIYKPGTKTFPMVSFVYLLVRKSSYGATVARFIKFAMSFKGQLLVSNDFIPLPFWIVSRNQKCLKGSLASFP